MNKFNVIPAEMAKVPIGVMWLYGQIEPEQRNKIIVMFPKTRLYINGQAYNENVEEMRIAPGRRLNTF